MKLTDAQKIQLFNALGTTWMETLPTPVMKRILRLYSATDLAKRTNKAFTSITYHIKMAHIPGPSVKLNKRWYWTAADARIVEDYLSQRRYTPRRGRYSVEEIADMRRLYAAGMSQWDIARKYDSSQSLVSRVVNGKKYNSSPVE